MSVTSQLCVWEQLRIPSIDKTSAWCSCWSQMLTQTPRSHPILGFHWWASSNILLMVFLDQQEKVTHFIHRWQAQVTGHSICRSATAQSVFSAKTLCLNQLFLHYCCKSFPRFRCLQRDRVTEASITCWPLTLMTYHIYGTDEDVV